jgi:hypothetical protein
MVSASAATCRGRHPAAGTGSRQPARQLAGHHTDLRLRQPGDPKLLDQPLHPAGRDSQQAAGGGDTDRACSARSRRSSSQSGKLEPSRSFGMATSIVPARVSKSRPRYPLRELIRSAERAPYGAQIASASADINACTNDLSSERKDPARHAPGARPRTWTAQYCGGWRSSR